MTRMERSAPGRSGFARLAIAACLAACHNPVRGDANAATSGAASTPSTIAPERDAHTSAPGEAVDAAASPEGGAHSNRTPTDRQRELLALADSLVQRVATVRRLDVRRPLERGVLGREEIVSRLRERVRHEYPAGEIGLEGVLYERLGLLPSAATYERTVFDLLEEQVAGFYDPDARTLYIADWVPPLMQSLTLAHEIDHALQDQHFDIARFTHHVRGGGDAQTAAMAVVEGDATLLMLEITLSAAGRSLRQRDLGIDPEQALSQTGGGPESARLRAAPRALREMLMFPYTSGFSVCLQSFRDRGDFSGIDAMLRQPPASTEQILHPDRLQSHEAPIDVGTPTPPSLATDHVLAYDDVAGEFGTRLFLESVLPRPISAEAAAGWGGDRAMLFVPRSSGAPDLSAASRSGVLAWVVEFDRAPGRRPDAEAIAFEHAADAVLSQRHATATSSAAAGFTHAWITSPGRAAAIARRGRRVWIFENAPADRLAGLVP